MNLQLRPELQRFLDDQVKQGRFASQTEAVEAGIARLMLDPEPDTLDARDVEEIGRSLEQMRRGEVIDWRQHGGMLREKYLGK